MVTHQSMRLIRMAGCGAILTGAVLLAIAAGVWPFQLFGFVAWAQGARGGAILVLAVLGGALAVFARCLVFLGWRPPEDKTEENRQIRIQYRRVPQLKTFTRLVQGAAILGFVASMFMGARVDGHLLLAGLVCIFSGLWFAWVFPHFAAVGS
jgi:hypothetical protein